MTPAEIMKKVKRIEIRTRHLVNTVFSGEYHSVFKGKGMAFAEVREYEVGDDIRTIDWNVTARIGRPFVKVYDEERELTVVLMVDASGSGDFGTVEGMKGEVGVEICALLAFAAIQNNDRVGLIIFTDDVETYIPPKKGKRHVLRVLRELLYFQPGRKGTDITAALGYLSRVATRRCVVFLVSDFMDSGYEKPLKVSGRRHDLIAVAIHDPREAEMPDVGIVELEDAETGDTVSVDTSDPSLRMAFSNAYVERTRRRDRLFESAGVDRIDVSTARSYVEPLSRFFRIRSRKLQA
jgi:uncharacterized protein (DUF58 family)